MGFTPPLKTLQITIPAVVPTPPSPGDSEKPKSRSEGDRRREEILGGREEASEKSRCDGFFFWAAVLACSLGSVATGNHGDALIDLSKKCKSGVYVSSVGQT